MSLGVGRIPFSQTVLGTLIAVWIVMLAMVYARLLQLRADTARLLLTQEHISAAGRLTIVSLADWSAREATLSNGDSVLVFTHTLDYDRKGLL